MNNLPTVENLKKVGVSASVVYGGLVLVLVAFSVLSVLEGVPLVSKILEVMGLWFLFQNKKQVIELVKKSPEYIKELAASPTGVQVKQFFTSSTVAKLQGAESKEVKETNSGVNL